MNSITSAIRAAIGHRASVQPSIEPVSDDVRLDGKVCLVTGANSGLGKAVAELARRGGTVLMACRGGHPEAGEDVKRASGSDAVRMLKVDLSDLQSVQRLCDELSDTTRKVDLAVLNAGLMPARPSRSKQGFELMFAVHFLANRVLVDRLVVDGLLGGSAASRIVLVSSETHRGAEPIDFDRLGAFVQYRFKDGLKVYGQSKLVQCTYAQELSRRLNRGGRIGVAVHALCPGSAHTKMIEQGLASYARLRGIRPLLRWMSRLVLLTPAQAAQTALLCATDPRVEGGRYYERCAVSRRSAAAMDGEVARRLWDASARWVADG